MSRVLRATTAAALALAGGALLALAAAPIGVRVDLWDFRTGFQVLRWAVYLGAGGALLGVVSTLAGWTTGSRRARALGVLALLLAAPAVAVPLSQYARARSLPPINDVTTDPADPPVFTAAGRGAPGGAAGAAYPGEAFASQQARAYPDLVTLTLPEPPAEVYRAALDVARASPGWEVALADSSAARIEATVTTRWFRFLDDVVVRVRPLPGGGTGVDLRSRSRVGVSDVGANAERVREFRRALLDRLGSQEGE